jgi:hypothetical protein
MKRGCIFCPMFGLLFTHLPGCQAGTGSRDPRSLGGSGGALAGTWVDLLLYSQKLYEVSFEKWYFTGGVPSCERSLPQCSCSLLVGNATVVVADMSTCDSPPPKTRKAR